MFFLQTSVITRTPVVVKIHQGSPGYKYLYIYLIHRIPCMIQYIYCSYMSVDFLMVFLVALQGSYGPKKDIWVGRPSHDCPSQSVGRFQELAEQAIHRLQEFKPQAGCSVPVLVGADSDSSIRKPPLDLWFFPWKYIWNRVKGWVYLEEERMIW